MILVSKDLLNLLIHGKCNCNCYWLFPSPPWLVLWIINALAEDTLLRRGFDFLFNAIDLENANEGAPFQGQHSQIKGDIVEPCKRGITRVYSWLTASLVNQKNCRDLAVGLFTSAGFVENKLRCSRPAHRENSNRETQRARELHWCPRRGI